MKRGMFSPGRCGPHGAVVALAALVAACGNEVAFTPTPEPEPCPEIPEGTWLSSLEAVDAMMCRHPKADGWQLLELNARLMADRYGLSKWWGSTLMNVTSGEVVAAGVRSETGETMDPEPYSACGVGHHLQVPDSSAFDQALPCFGGSIEATREIRAAHGCAEGGTCGRTVVTMSELGITYSCVFAPDGTLLGTVAGEATGCEDL